MNIWVPTALGSLSPLSITKSFFLSLPHSLCGPVCPGTQFWPISCVYKTLLFFMKWMGHYSGTCVAFAWDTARSRVCIWPQHLALLWISISTSTFENQTLGMEFLKPVGSYPDLYPSEKQCMVLMQVVLPRSPLVLKPLTGPWAGRKHRDEKHCRELKLLTEVFI